MINKTQIVEFKRIFTLLTHQSEEDTLRIDKSIEFYKERDFLVNILVQYNKFIILYVLYKMVVKALISGGA